MVRTLAAIAVLLAGGPALAEDASLTILHVNDTHSHLDAIGPKDAHLDGTLGGLAKAATVIQRLRAAEPEALLLHGGDLFQGDSYFNATLGTSELGLLASLGLDAMAVGNHELVFGPGILRDVLAAAFPQGGFPLLAANLDVSPVPGLDQYVGQRLLKQVGGVTVGIFGLLTPFDPSERPDPAILTGGDPQAIAAIATEQAGLLRGAGAQVVVCLSHLGFDLDRIVAAGSSGVDVIVGGHSHTALSEPKLAAGLDGRQVVIVQAGDYYQYVGKLTLSVHDGRVRLAGYRLVPVDEHVRRQPEVAAAVKGLQERIGDALFHQPIAFSLHDLTKAVDAARPERDTALGNLVADALRHRTGADIGLTVDGFLEDRVARGIVVGDDLFRVTSDGFDPTAPDFPGPGFRIFTFEITGAELASALEQTIAAGGDFFLEVSGMRYAYDSSQPPLQRLVRVLVHGQKLDPARLYTVAVNGGVAAALGTLVQVEVRDLQDAGDYEFLALQDWARRLVFLDYRSEGRILDLAVRER